MSCSFFFFSFATLLIFPSSSSSFPTYPVIHPPSTVAPTFTCWPQQQPPPHLSMYVLAFRVAYILRAKGRKERKKTTSHHHHHRHHQSNPQYSLLLSGVCGGGEGDWECEGGINEGGDGKYCDWSNHVRRRLSSLSSSSFTFGFLHYYYYIGMYPRLLLWTRGGVEKCVGIFLKYFFIFFIGRWDSFTFLSLFNEM